MSKLTPLIPCCIVALVLCTAEAPWAADQTLNGTWALDEEASQNLDDVAREFNRGQNERERRKEKQGFSRDEMTTNSGGNRYDKQMRATTRMIREDNRSKVWDVADNARLLLEAESIRLYESRKVAVLYGSDAKRLLTVNPAGRAYSASGTQITRDQFGRSLTYRDGEAIVIETDLVSGDRLVERFVPDSEADRMMMEIRLQEGARGPWLEFVRVFDRTN